MKIKCNWAGYSSLDHSSAEERVVFIIHPDEVGEFWHDMSQYKPTSLLTIEVKKYKPLRTLTQNAFFHKTVGYLAFKLGMDAAIVKEGIKQAYGYKVKVFGEYLVPKPSHLCNKFEEMNALFEGCFAEAGAQGIDMRDYILKWERYKKERMNEKNKGLVGKS